MYEKFWDFLYPSPLYKLAAYLSYEIHATSLTTYIYFSMNSLRCVHTLWMPPYI